MSATAKNWMVDPGTPVYPYSGIGMNFLSEKIQQPVKIALVPKFLESKTSVDYEHTKQDDGTTSGFATNINELSFTTAKAILEIRIRSGLTWELLSELFNVSRRSIHHWANGKIPSARHEREIWQVLKAIRHLDEGRPSATRTRLLATDEGVSIFDLLSHRRYAEVLRLPAGAGLAFPKRRRRTHLDASRTHKLPPPTILLDAIQERPRIPSTKARIASVVRVNDKTP